MASHHPNVERWRNLVQYFFGQTQHPEDVEYAMMVMWGESGGNPQAKGPSLSNGTQAQGLFQHLPGYWNSRVRQAQQYWRAKGVTIGDDPNDPATNIAVAAWLRDVGGWGHWAVTYNWYKPGTWGANTTWDGYQYQNLVIPSTGRPPRGDGQVAEGRREQGQAGFALPLSGVPVPSGAGSLFGAQRTGHIHAGVDFSAAEGTPVGASRAGRVVFAGYRNDSAGYTVTVDHGGGWVTDYMHLTASGIAVKVGDTVTQGQTIAQVGQTGNADGPHLHFQIKYQGVARDPVGLLGGGPGVTAPQAPKTRDQFAGRLLSALFNKVSEGVAGTLGVVRQTVEEQGIPLLNMSELMANEVSPVEGGQPNLLAAPEPTDSGEGSVAEQRSSLWKRMTLRGPSAGERQGVV